MKKAGCRLYDYGISLLIYFGLIFNSGVYAQRAVDSLELAVERSEGIDKIKALNNLAGALLEYDLDESMDVAGKALELAGDKEFLEEKARAQKIIADALYYQTDYLQAIEYYKASAETEKELHGEWSENYQNRLGDVGFCYNERAMYDKAIEYYNMALEIARKRNDREEMGTNLNNLGQSYFAQGDFSKAITYFDQTLQIDRDRQIDEYISIDLNNIGKVYFTWGKYGQALEYYFEALDKAVAVGNEHMQAIRNSNIGQVYLAVNDYENALKHFNIALDLDRKLGNTGKLGIRYSHIGMLHLRKGHYNKAQEYFLNAIRIFESQNMTSSRVITLNHLGDLMKVKNDYTGALGYYQQSLSISEKAGMKAEMLRNLKSISDVYQKMADFQKAFEFLTRHSILKDTVFNEEKYRQVAEFEARYETEKKERENLVLRNEARLQRNQKVIFIISGAALLMIAVILFFLLNVKRKSLRKSRLLYEKDNQLHQLVLEKKEKENQHLQEVLFAEEQINMLQKEKLQQKSRELSTSTLLILNKNEALDNLRKIAGQAIKNENIDKKECLRNLVKEIDANTDLDEQWDQFKIHFESVHKGFFRRLTDHCPSLTHNDLKLCAYLRMNLSSKEIARMLHISSESVATKRYRLRKKLGLGNEENLVTFIGKF